MNVLARHVLVWLCILAALTGCTSRNAVPSPSLVKPETTIPARTSESATLETAPTASEGPSLSYKVATFYYPWYGNPETDGKWIHWTQNNHLPPDDIASDYYPLLAAYSSNDPVIVAQHMEWLRQAGIGVIISSWWGQGSREDGAVPLLLKIAEEYGIKVAFHIEPYDGRTADTLIGDIKYLYQRYGRRPAFFRSTATSQFSADPSSKGMFFVWNIGSKGSEGERVQAEYWREAMDTIHALPEGALIIANTTDGSWVSNGHLDGLYNYATLHLEESHGFDWARSLPPASLYVPSVIPGFSARRVGYAQSTFVERGDGQTYNEQWTAALGTGIQPELVTITSFNEWHEGSMIEPPQFGVMDGNEYAYPDFGTLPAEGYLDLTRTWMERYLSIEWPLTYRARIKVTTTSDWTTLDVVSGGAWMRPQLISTSADSNSATLEAGDRLLLTQSLADASSGSQVEMIWDVLLTGLSPGNELTLQIDRGNLGQTQVTIFNYLGETPIEVGTFEWDRVTSGRNSHQITIPLELLTTTTPRGRAQWTTP